MRCSTSKIYPRQIAVVVCAAMVCGCANFQMPRIDPTGESLFVYDSPPAASGYGTTPYGQTPYHSTPAYSTSTPGYYGTPAPSYDEIPGQMRWGDNVCITLSPTRTIAPVGSEVVLLAGVVDVEGFLRTNERIEWTLSPAGVGHFVDFDKQSWTDLLLWDFTRPKKISNNFAVTSTSRTYLRLTRGTPAANDDVAVLRGQTWITVASDTEGTSQVTAFAPSVYGWNRRKQTATIHWVDAQWRLPPPSINPAGTSHVFTTSVTRHSDGSPCVGWRVRYEIVGGPAAGFAPDGAQITEVATDTAGQASVEIFQRQPASGTNRVMIQVIRPATLASCVEATAAGKRIVVGSGSTSKTWTSPEISVQKTGPAVASVGATITYRIEVATPGDLPTRDVVLTDELPEGLDYLDSTPAATQTGRQLRWQLGQLAARQTRVLEVRFRTNRQGTMTSCAEATAAGGLRARDCVTTTVGAATVDVSASGPDRAKVGDQVTFEIVITNRGQTTATGLLIKNRFDEGLGHSIARSPIERSMGSLAPGQSQRISVTFRVVREGRLCQQIEVTGAGGILATAQACLTATRAVPGQPVPQPEPSGQAAISVRKTGPSTQNIGEKAEFTIHITNTGTQTLTNVKVTDNYDKNLRPLMATDGHRVDGDNLIWTIDSLAPGKSVRFEVHCRCQEAALRACNRVSVVTDQGLKTEKEACLSIRSAASPHLPSISNLTMSVADLRDPITVDKELTYEVRVTNNSQASDKRVTVVATVPDQMMAVPLGTSGPAKFDISGQIVRFEPVAEIRAGETLTYRIRVRARQSGDVQFRAQLTSQNAQQAMTVEEQTQILAR